MKKELLIFFCFVSVMCIAQDKIPYFGESDYNYNTYKQILIKENHVKTLTEFYCDRCNESVRNDTVKYYKKYFDKNGEELKVIAFKKPSKIYSIDTFIKSNKNEYSDLYTIKKKRINLSHVFLDISEREEFLKDKKSIEFYKKNGVSNIVFRDSLLLNYYRYEIKGTELKLFFAEETDSLGNYKFKMFPDGNLNQIDTFVFKYDYTKLTGKSTITLNGVKYLHSTVILNKNLQLYQENIFNVEYNKLDVKLAKTIEPTYSKIYHYLENGLVDYIEILSYNNRDLYIFTYEFY